MLPQRSNGPISWALIFAAEGEMLSNKILKHLHDMLPYVIKFVSALNIGSFG